MSKGLGFAPGSEPKEIGKTILDLNSEEGIYLLKLANHGATGIYESAINLKLPKGHATLVTLMTATILLRRFELTMNKKEHFAATMGFVQEMVDELIIYIEK